MQVKIDGGSRRDPISVVSAAVRESIERSLQPDVRDFDRKVLLAVISIVSSYSRLEDDIYVAHVAAVTYQEPTVEEWQRRKVSQSLRRLSEVGIVRYEPGRGRPAKGHGPRSLIGLPSPKKVPGAGNLSAVAHTKRKVPGAGNLFTTEKVPPGDNLSHAVNHKKGSSPGEPCRVLREERARADRPTSAKEQLDVVAIARRLAGDFDADRIAVTIRILEERDRSGRRPDKTWLSLARGIARRLHSEEIEEVLERIANDERRSDERSRTATCELCDDQGRLLEDGVPVEPILYCAHVPIAGETGGAA